MNSKQCSDLFSEIFDSHCSGIVRTCECGITYFNATEDESYNKGELENLEELEKKQPEKYISVDHSIGSMKINGVEIVYGCSCNLANECESFLINNAEEIAEYLNRRAEGLRKEADSIKIKKPGLALDKPGKTILSIKE